MLCEGAQGAGGNETAVSGTCRTMQSEWKRAASQAMVVACALTASLAGTGSGQAQSCTSQAKMSPEFYSAMSGAAMSLAANVKAGDAAKVQSETVTEYATNFGPTAYLIHSTADKIATETLHVVQVYQLDATKRAAGDNSPAEFSCPLTGTAAETDFTFSNLPAGMYGFAMVEAEGNHPWILSFVLQQVGGAWKMGGFYSHARAAAGHDGLWYWNTARQKAKADQLWLSWLLYGEAESLLRPAGFVTSTNLDKLLSEEAAAKPPALSDGIGPETPLVMKGAADSEFRFTAISAEGSDDGKRLGLILHLKADALPDPAAARARNTAAAKAFLDAHKELRQSFDEVWVHAESQGKDPFVTEQKIAEIP